MGAIFFAALTLGITWKLSLHWYVRATGIFIAIE